MTKTFSFTVVHFVVAFSVGFALTGSIAIGGAIALIEPAVNSVAYFFHEKAWERAHRARTPPEARRDFAPCLRRCRPPLPAGS